YVCLGYSGAECHCGALLEAGRHERQQYSRARVGRLCALYVDANLDLAADAGGVQTPRALGDFENNDPTHGDAVAAHEELRRARLAHRVQGVEIGRTVASAGARRKFRKQRGMDRPRLWPFAGKLERWHVADDLVSRKACGAGVVDLLEPERRDPKDDGAQL